MGKDRKTFLCLLNVQTTTVLSTVVREDRGNGNYDITLENSEPGLLATWSLFSKNSHTSLSRPIPGRFLFLWLVHFPNLSPRTVPNLSWLSRACLSGASLRKASPRYHQAADTKEGVVSGDGLWAPALPLSSPGTEDESPLVISTSQFLHCHTRGWLHNISGSFQL